MTPAQTIQIRLSECRQRLNTLLQIETRSTEEQTELEALTKEVGAKEPELRAALAAEPDPNETRVEGRDAADVELRSLIHDASPGRILAAVHARRNTDGREAERADGLAAILATAERPRTDGRGVESHTTAHRRGRLDAVIASLLFMGGLRRSEVAAVAGPT